MNFKTPVDITMPDGLFGFENYRNFQLKESEYQPFLLLSSKDEKPLSFYLIDPFVFRPDYEIDVADESLKVIGITSPSDVIVMCVVTIPSDGTKITADLQGPMIINKKTGYAKQIISGDSRWLTKHDILEESCKNGEKAC